MTSARNHLMGRVSEIAPQGVMVQVTIDCGFPLTATITRGAVEDLCLVPGASVIAAIKAGAVHLCRDRSAEQESSILLVPAARWPDSWGQDTGPFTIVGDARIHARVISLTTNRNPEHYCRPMSAAAPDGEDSS